MSKITARGGCSVDLSHEESVALCQLLGGMSVSEHKSQGLTVKEADLMGNLYTVLNEHFPYDDDREAGT